MIDQKMQAKIEKDRSQIQFHNYCIYKLKHQDTLLVQYNFAQLKQNVILNFNFNFTRYEHS